MAITAGAERGADVKAARQLRCDGRGEGEEEEEPPIPRLARRCSRNPPEPPESSNMKT